MQRFGFVYVVHLVFINCSEKNNNEDLKIELPASPSYQSVEVCRKPYQENEQSDE